MKVLLPCLLLAAACLEAAPFEVHGHRGAMAVRPENTLPSFQEAIRAGADFIELDVYATRDDVLVVAHDPEINMAICQGEAGSGRSVS